MNKNLYEVLSEDEQVMIEHYVIEYATGYRETAPLDKLLQFWAAKKVDLYKMLGNNLSIHKSVVAEKEREQLETEVMNKLQSRRENGESTFYDNYLVWLKYNFPRLEPESWTNYDVNLKGVFQSQEDYQTMQNLIENQEALINNRYEGRRITIHTPSDHDYTFCSGTKLLKIFKKLADEFKIVGFERFRLKHSQICNEKTIKGEMYLTIHPLDFMTMSDNDCGWHSCMSWVEEGDYRRGTVEMMNSPMVIEAYLRSTIDMDMPGGGKWDNKRWRQLFIVNKDCIVAIKGYPYWNRGLEKIALEWIKELAEKNLGWQYQNVLYNYDNPSDDVTYFNEAQNQWISTDYQIRFETVAMYNDLYSDHKMFLSKDYPEDEEKTFEYSGVANCMICGEAKNFNDFDDESELTCDTCLPHIYCNRCGAEVTDDPWIIDGVEFCQWCAADLPVCSGCEEPHIEEHITELYLGDKETGEVYACYRDFCDDCIESGLYFPESARFEVHQKQSYWFGDDYRTIFVVDINQLTEDGKVVFDLDEDTELMTVDWEYSYHGYRYNYIGRKQVILNVDNPVYDLDHLYIKVKIREDAEHPNVKTIECAENINFSFTDYEGKTPEELCYELLQMIYPNAPEKELRAFKRFEIQFTQMTKATPSLSNDEYTYMLDGNDFKYEVQKNDMFHYVDELGRVLTKVLNF